MVDGVLTPLIRDRTSGGPLNGSPYRCPVCHESETVALASGVSRAGRGRLLLADGNIGEYETELAALLSEPPRPREQTFSEVVTAVAIGLAMVVLTLVAVAVLRWQEFTEIPAEALDIALIMGVAWFGLLMPVVMLGRFLENRHRMQEELPRWREAVARWRQACYCSRDDIVFVPGRDEVPLAPEDASRLWAGDDSRNGHEHVQRKGSTVIAEGATE